MDSSLVSNKNFSEILPFSSWTLGKVIWGKMTKNLHHLWGHSQKTRNPKPNFSFIADSKTCWVIWGFEQQLSSTIDWRATELQSGAKIAFSKYDIFVDRLWKCSQNEIKCHESCRQFKRCTCTFRAKATYCCYQTNPMSQCILFQDALDVSSLVKTRRPKKVLF